MITHLKNLLYKVPPSRNCCGQRPEIHTNLLEIQIRTRYPKKGTADYWNNCAKIWIVSNLQGFLDSVLDPFRTVNQKTRKFLVISVIKQNKTQKFGVYVMTLIFKISTARSVIGCCVKKEVFNGFFCWMNT